MKNTFGSSLSVTLFGESHGEMIGAVIDGIAPGIRIDHERIRTALGQRRPYGKISTARVEEDKLRIVSGEYGGYTTGAPLTILIPNEDTRSSDYDKFKVTPRPSHADLTAGYKYHGFEDHRGGGHFSGRVTAALVAAGALVAAALEERGIYIGTHIASLGGVSDRPFLSPREDIALLAQRTFPVIDDEAAEAMKKYVEECAESGDSTGGVLESCVVGIPEGVGEPWFDTVEGVLAHALFSVPAIKGVEFGAGFGFARMRGSEANDPYAVEDGKIVTVTNNSGGICGGITNGMPLIYRCAVKPTPTIFRAQRTVDLTTMTEAELTCHGRHDPAIIHRARAVVDAVSALAIADLLALRYGTDWLRGKQ